MRGGWVFNTFCLNINIYLFEKKIYISLFSKSLEFQFMILKFEVDFNNRNVHKVSTEVVSNG